MILPSEISDKQRRLAKVAFWTLWVINLGSTLYLVRFENGVTINLWPEIAVLERVSLGSGAFLLVWVMIFGRMFKRLLIWGNCALALTLFNLTMPRF